MGIETGLYYTGNPTEPGRVVVQYHYDTDVYGEDLRKMPVDTLTALLPQNPIKFSFFQVRDELTTYVKVAGMDQPRYTLEDIPFQEATARNFRPAVINRLERKFEFHKAQIKEASEQIHAISKEYHRAYSYVPADQLKPVIAQDERIKEQRHIAMESLRETGTAEFMLAILKHGEHF